MPSTPDTSATPTTPDTGNDGAASALPDRATPDPSSPSQPQTAFASAANPSTAEELLGRLVAYRPIEVRSVETRVGLSQATFCQLLEITPNGTGVDLGERPIFWQVVRQQLAKASKQVPWIAGRLVLSGQAYRLEALTPTDERAVAAALTAVPV